MSKILYSWESFDEDLKIIEKYIRAWGRKPHFVCRYKTTIPFAHKLSNIFNVDFSVVENYQGVCRYVKNGMPSIKNSLVIVIEDEIKTGKTVSLIDDLLTDDGYSNIVYMTIYDNSRATKIDDINIRISNLRLSNGEEIIFPWDS
jgi:hypoxanthine-guanine phosphoribosyltransferase